MCDDINSIRFCTCGTVPKTAQSYWKLSIVNPLHPKVIVVGLITLGEPSEESFSDRLLANLERRILEALNSRGSFDFEYSPARGDRMTVVISKKHRLAFEFEFDGDIFGVKSAYDLSYYPEYIDAGEGLSEIGLAEPM